MRISDLRSDVCSSDLISALSRSGARLRRRRFTRPLAPGNGFLRQSHGDIANAGAQGPVTPCVEVGCPAKASRCFRSIDAVWSARAGSARRGVIEPPRSEEHTSELQSLMRTSYAVFCL